MSVISEIADERKRQIEKEGWTHKHDDEHSDGELALIASLYASPINLYIKDVRSANKSVYLGKGVSIKIMQSETFPAEAWPCTWDGKWDKRKIHDKRQRLVIAGALIVAEIERLDRAGLVNTEQSG